MSFLANLNPFKAPAAPASAPAASAQNPPHAGDTKPAPADESAGKQLKDVDPLAMFAKMYDTVPNTETPPQFSLDDAALDAAAQANDFTKGFDPAKRAAAQQGDASALEAMMQHVGRQAYRASLAHNAALTGKFTEVREQFNSKGFGQKVRGELTASALVDTPNYQNPVVKAQLVRTAQDLQRQHPDASPQEIAGMTRQYFAELSAAINPQANQQQKPQGETDWDDFFAEDAS